MGMGPSGDVMVRERDSTEDVPDGVPSTTTTPSIERDQSSASKIVYDLGQPWMRPPRANRYMFGIGQRL